MKDDKVIYNLILDLNTYLSLLETGYISENSENFDECVVFETIINKDKL